MDKVKGILFLLVIVLGLSTFFLFVQAGTAKAQAADGQALANATKELLRLQDVRCAQTGPEDIAARCIRPLLAAKDFEEDAFRQPRDGESGYLVIKNENRRAYEADDFAFLFNRVPTQDGCAVPGKIDYQVTCRFDFPQECRDGDILEVFYPVDGKPVRVFLKTC